MGRKTARDNGTCDVEYMHADKASRALKRIPPGAMINALAETFRAMSDPTRVRIIAALAAQELCVCDLAHILGITGSAVSHQLRLLRGQRLVRYRKEGKVAFYSLDDKHIEHLFAEGVRHVEAG